MAVARTINSVLSISKILLTIILLVGFKFSVSEVVRKGGMTGSVDVLCLCVFERWSTSLRGVQQFRRAIQRTCRAGITVCWQSVSPTIYTVMLDSVSVFCCVTIMIQ